MGTLQDIINDLGCWNSITCINSNNLDLIEQVINKIFQQEGCRRIAKPPLPDNSKPLLQELLRSRNRTGLWVIGLSLGNFRWTVIKNSDRGLFCRRAKSAIRPRIAELAMQIGYDAFVYEIRNPYIGALLEANLSGQTFVSGFLDNNNGMGDNDVFCYEPVNQLSGGFDFYLLNTSRELKAISRKTDINEEERQKKVEQLEEFIKKYPEQINYALSEYKKIHDNGFVRDNENLGQLLCKSNSFWHENNLLHKAFAEPEQLEKDGVRLLFFQVSRFDLNPETEEIWLPITSREDYRIEQDILW